MYVNLLLSRPPKGGAGIRKVTFYRYIVEDFKGVLLLVLIFNGNLAIPNRINQLSKWIDSINGKLENSKSTIFNLVSTITLITTVFIPTLTDAWLSGFTDAEGTFNINITKRDNTKTGYRIQLRYLLDQKYAMELLTLIKNLFNHGKVIVRKQDMYRYYCDTFVGLKKASLFFTTIITYFDTFPLKTKKALTLNNWKEVYNMVINKEQGSAH